MKHLDLARNELHKNLNFNQFLPFQKFSGAGGGEGAVDPTCMFEIGHLPQLQYLFENNNTSKFLPIIVNGRIILQIIK